MNYVGENVQASINSISGGPLYDTFVPIFCQALHRVDVLLAICLFTTLNTWDRGPIVLLKSYFTAGKTVVFFSTGLSTQQKDTNIFRIGATWPDKNEKKSDCIPFLLQG